MKFLKLVDPRDVMEGSGLSFAEQAQRARDMFPVLVAKSALHYWTPPRSISSDCDRILLGVAPTYNLTDMRVLDLINERLRVGNRVDYRVDVFDVEDVVNVNNPSILTDLAQYFPGLSYVPASTPFVGVWNRGRHVGNWWGGGGIDHVLHLLDIPTSAAAIAAAVRPPAAEMMED